MRIGNWFITATTFLLIVTSSCGRSSTPPAITDSQTGQVPAALDARLQDALAQEFDRLGIDPEKVAASAPGGDDSVVFNLAAYLIDPDGVGGNPATGVELRWTERAPGDYDQNGEVNIGDLTPLGMHINKECRYDMAAQHNGFPSWPTGNPDDDGGSSPGTPPAAGSPAENWRLARVDGDLNGQLNINDVTPIAQHWNERLDGYRVYRWRPGDSSFMLLPDPANPSAQYTIARPTPADPTRPVRISFTDTDLGATPTGYYEYYVVPFDGNNGLEGMPSNYAGANVEDGGAGNGLPPVAILTADVDHGNVPLTVNFDAGQSYDPDGSIAKFEWAIPGAPGGWWDSGLTATQQMTYNSAGTVPMTIRVTDDTGKESTVTMKISVGTSGGNLPPVAEVHAVPDAGVAPLTVDFDASASLDHDGSIAKYEWDMDRDPTNGYEYDGGTNPTFQLQFTAAGVFDQWVRVTDNDGLTDEAMAGVVVEDSTGNIPPVAGLTSDTQEGDAPLMVNFDASSSFDHGGNILQYEWDFDSDSVFDDTTSIPISTHTYNTPGNFTARVRVTDDAGATADAYLNITAHGWATTVVATPGTALSVGNYLSAQVVNGYPAIAYFHQNTVTDSDLIYVQANSTTGSSWKTPVVVADAGSNATGVFPSMAVVNGNPAIVYSNMSGSVLEFIRANDADGDTWPAFSNVVESSTLAMNSCLAVINGNPAVSYYEANGSRLMYCRSTSIDGATWPASVTVNSTAGSGAESSMMDNGTNLPLISQVSQVSNTALHERGKDADGTAWESPHFLSNAQLSADDNISLLGVNGRAAVAFYGEHTITGPGLYYVQANDMMGFIWLKTAIQIATGLNDGRDCSMALVGGNPAVAFGEYGMSAQYSLSYVRATDIDGDTWGNVESVDARDGSGYEASLIVMDGHPGIAYYYSPSGELWFAYRY